MAISEIPSLHLKPVAYKTNKLYLKIPEGSIGNMTFARTSIATRVNNEGLIEEVATGIPRLDYPLINGVVQSCPELLLEPTSTNLLLRSEEIDNASWFKAVGITISSNFTISPDGTQNAERIQLGSGGKQIEQTIATVTEGEVYTISVWIKSIIQNTSNRTFQLAIYADGSLLVNNNALLLDENFNKWNRYTRTFTIPATSASVFKIRLNGSSNGSTGDEYHIWGAQLEELPYATSYIKTEGSTETRATETLNSAGDSSTFNSVEGVLYVEMKALFDDLTQRGISISDSTAVNTIFLRYSTTTNQIHARLIVASSIEGAITFTISDITEFSKFAFKYKANDFALWIDGIEVGTDNSGTTFPADTLTELNFDKGGGSEDFYSRTREVKVYKTALTDSELESLTS